MLTSDQAPWRTDPKFGGISDESARRSWEAEQAQILARVRALVLLSTPTTRQRPPAPMTTPGRCRKGLANLACRLLMTRPHSIPSCW